MSDETKACGYCGGYSAACSCEEVTSSARAEITRLTAALREAEREKDDLAREALRREDMLVLANRTTERCQANRDTLRAELAALRARLAPTEAYRAALEEISLQLPCDHPCDVVLESSCDKCGHETGPRWCAGCTARAALSQPAAAAGVPGSCLAGVPCMYETAADCPDIDCSHNAQPAAPATCTVDGCSDPATAPCGKHCLDCEMGPEFGECSAKSPPDDGRITMRVTREQYETLLRGQPAAPAIDTGEGKVPRG